MHQLNCKSMYLNWSSEEVINLILIASSLDYKKAKALAWFPALTGCDTMEKFKGKSREAWTKFLQVNCKI